MRAERGRDTVSSLLTSACHRGPLGVCSLSQVAGSHLLNPLLLKKKKKKNKLLKETL